MGDAEFLIEISVAVLIFVAGLLYANFRADRGIERSDKRQLIENAMRQAKDVADEAENAWRVRSGDEEAADEFQILYKTILTKLERLEVYISQVAKCFKSFRKSKSDLIADFRKSCTDDTTFRNLGVGEKRIEIMKGENELLRNLENEYYSDYEKNRFLRMLGL